MRLYLHLSLIIAAIVLVAVVNPQTFEGALLVWGNLLLQIVLTGLYCKRDIEQQESTRRHEQSQTSIG